MNSSDQVVEQGETYEHDDHAIVEVTGIWTGIQQVDSARNTNEKDVIIVRYSPTKAGEQVNELTKTLSEFLEAID